MTPDDAAYREYADTTQQTDAAAGAWTENCVVAGADGLAGADAPIEPSRLWRGDTGSLSEPARRALLELVKGPYLSGARSPQLWAALVADERAIRSRLHDLFLDLVIDRVGEFGFVRNVQADGMQAPAAVRTEALTFIDTAMLLVLRQMLLVGESDGRVIVGQDEVYEQLQVYRSADRDEADFTKRLNAAWTKMQNKLRVIHQAGEGRVEISPVLRLIVDADQIDAIAAEYRRIAGGAAGSGAGDAGAAGDHLEGVA